MFQFEKKIEFKEKKNQIDFEIIDCMADMINHIVDNMQEYYEDQNIHTLLSIDKRLEFHYDEIKNCKYIQKENVMETPINSEIVYISMYDNTLSKGILLKILKDDLYLIQNRNRILNVYLDSFYVFYRKYVKSKFRKLLQQIIDGDLKIKNKKSIKHD